MFQGIQGELGESASLFWQSKKLWIQKRVLDKGRYKRFIALAQIFLHTVQGRKRIEGLFASHTLEDQQHYFDTMWDTRRWRSIFKIFFNKKVLAKRGLSPDYFHFDDGTESFAESFYRRSKHAMTELSIEGNYFLSQYLLGRYQTEMEIPDYLRLENFKTIQSRLDKIQIVTADVKKWLASREPTSIDCLSLSNICELMSIEETATTFEEVSRTARKGAWICFRNLMIPRTVPDSLSNQIERDAALSSQLHLNDRSFVYSRVDALRVG